MTISIDFLKWKYLNFEKKKNGWNVLLEGLTNIVNKDDRVSQFTKGCIGHPILLHNQQWYVS